MSVYITKSYGLKGVAAEGQQIVANEAEKLGIEEIRIPYYDYFSDKDGLYKRLGGILTGVSEGDTVILQIPTWNYPNFESSFIGHIKSINKVRLIIFIHDIRAMMFPTEKESMPFYLELFNIADGLIVPSENMAKYLKENNVNTPMVVQTLWDPGVQIEFEDRPKFEKKISFAGDDVKYLISKNFPLDMDVDLHLYGRKNDNMVKNKNIHYHGFLDEYSLLRELHQGGFGLDWTENSYWREYNKYNTSFKLTNYLAAGIPLIMQSDNSCRKLVENNHLGIIADSLEEATEKIRNMSEEEYNGYVESIHRISPLIKENYFTKKVLIDGVYTL
ncbi:glycosyltransferase family protein [Ligilactobacillus salivarius]